MSGSLSTAVNKPVDGVAAETPVESEHAALDLWTRAIDRLKGRLSRHTFQTYFEPIKPLSLIENELTLAHSSKFMIDWVRDNLLDVLMQDLEAQHGVRCEVKFVVRERPGTEAEPQGDAQPEVRAPVTTPPPSEPPPSRQLQINPKYTFDSFVVGPSNQL